LYRSIYKCIYFSHDLFPQQTLETGVYVSISSFKSLFWDLPNINLIQFILFSPGSQITNLPQRVLQSVRIPVPPNYLVPQVTAEISNLLPGDCVSNRALISITKMYYASVATLKYCFARADIVRIRFTDMPCFINIIESEAFANLYI